jgi:hypothetical protein
MASFHPGVPAHPLGHRIGAAEAPVIIEVFLGKNRSFCFPSFLLLPSFIPVYVPSSVFPLFLLPDFCCPFSAKMWNTLHDVVLPKYTEKVCWGSGGRLWSTAQLFIVRNHILFVPI